MRERRHYPTPVPLSSDVERQLEATVVLWADGAEAEGAARVIAAPEADAKVKFVVSVYVKVKALVDEPATVVVVETVTVPVPSPVAAEATPTSSSDDAAEAGIETGMRILRNRFIGFHLSKTPVRQWKIRWRTVWDHQHAQATTRRNYRRWFVQVMERSRGGLPRTDSRSGRQGGGESP